jgi:ABC-type sulfate transport system permease subunit
MDMTPAEFVGEAKWRYFTNQSLPGIIWTSSKAAHLTMARAKGQGIMVLPKPIRIRELVMAIHIAAHGLEQAEVAVTPLAVRPAVPPIEAENGGTDFLTFC